MSLSRYQTVLDLVAEALPFLPLLDTITTIGHRDHPMSNHPISIEAPHALLFQIVSIFSTVILNIPYE